MATVIRQIGKFLAKEDIPTGSYTPMLAPVAIRIIDEAQDINQKKLLSPLKALDYQSRERFLIFCTTDPGKLDRAIIDRCTRVHLQPLGRDQAVVLVEKILGRPDADMAVKIHQAGITRPRAIIETVETVEKGLTLEAAIRNIKSL